MQDVYKHIDEYIIDKERKILRAFDDMIADMISNEKLNAIVTELFIRGKKLFPMYLLHNHTLRFQKMLEWILLTFYHKNSKQKRTSTNWINNSSDISTKDFINIYNKYTVESYSFLVNDATFASDNPLRFRKNLFNI